MTYSHCVPTLLDMLLRDPGSSSTDLSGWKITIGGSALPQGLSRAALDRGMDVFSGYGMSETCAGTLLVRFDPALEAEDPERALALRCKAGRPLPLVDLRIVDEQMRDVPRDDATVGEVVVRSPWSVQGYIDSPEASEVLWAGGYLHTQDLARVDAQGYVTIVDRLKDVIKSGGEWISSLTLESLISSLPGVAEVAVIGRPDARWGERPLALVVAKPSELNPNGVEKEIRAHLQRQVSEGRISRFSMPDEIVFVPALARTSVGKVDKRVLRGIHG